MSCDACYDITRCSVRGAVFFGVVRGQDAVDLLVVPMPGGCLDVRLLATLGPWGGDLTAAERAEAEERVWFAAVLRGDDEARAAARRAMVDEVKDARPVVVERPWAGEVAA